MISQDQLIKEEQAILNKVIDQLDNAMLKEYRNLTKSQLEHKKAKDMCLPDTYGSLVRALNDGESARKNLKRVKKIKDELYDTRLELNCRELYQNGGIGSLEKLNLKVGLHTYCRGEDIIIISWVRPVCRHYLLDNSSEEYVGVVTGKNGEKYRTLYNLEKKRKVDIFFDKVKSVSHLFPMNEEEFEEIIADEFLQELLSRRTEEEFRNIVFSIQKKQGKIIQTPFRQNLIVQGCAGSGKSMIMLHRLPILLYDNPDELKKNRIYVITPSRTYIQMAQRMLIELEISDLQLGTLEEYYIHVLEKDGCSKQEIKALTEKKNLIKAANEIENYIYSAECLNQISKDIKSFISAGSVDFKNAYSTLGLVYKKTNVSLPESIIRKESVQLQELLNANNENLRKYFRSITRLIAELNNMERMLTARKEAVLRSINKEITLEETVLLNAKRDLSIINRALHPRMYNNRLRTIQTTTEIIRNLHETKNAIESNDDYFANLRSIAESINRLKALLNITKQDIDRPSTELMYRAAVLRDVFVNDSLSIVEQVFVLEDPYTEYVERLAGEAMNLTPHIDEVRSIADPVLEYEYYGKLKKRSKYLKLLSEHIDEDIYDHVMSRQGIQKNDKGEYPTYTFTPYLKLQILKMLQGTPNKGKETLIAIDEAQNLALEEYRLISEVNHKRVILNLYGDVKQHVEGTKGLDSWQDIKDIANFDIQYMNENYRNARQITQFCNDRFQIQMRAINLDGDGVHQIRDNQGFMVIIDKLFHSPLKPGISSIIVKTGEEASYLLLLAGGLAPKINDLVSEPSDLLPNKWNLLTIDQAKGLEFETAIVLSGRMTENEKYIAYTRALNELYVYDQVVDTSESNNNRNSAVNSTKPEKKTEKPLREKWNNEKKPEDKKKRIIVVRKGVPTTTIQYLDKGKEKSAFKPSLREFFEAAGLKTVDMRDKKGALWVVGSKGKIGKIVDEAVEKYNVSGAYASGKAIGYLEGWYTKSKK